MSQTVLSKKLGITRSSVNAWEMGINIPSTQYLIELSNIFMVSVDYLLCIEKRQTLDISGLTEDDISIVYRLTTHLRNKNSVSEDNNV